MVYFEVIVQRKNGQPAKGVKVANGYSNDHDYTDSDGRVIFELDTTKTKLYVDGRSHGEIKPGKANALKSA